MGMREEIRVHLCAQKLYEFRENNCNSNFTLDTTAGSIEESYRIQRNHEKVVNEGRDEEVLLETADGSALLKEEANKLLVELEIVAEFMDKEVFKDQNINWLQSIATQKENLLTPNGTLSGQVMEDLKDKDLSFRDLGNKMSNLHQNTMTSERSNLDELFHDATKKSFEDIKNIESKEQKDFEDYLKEFLEKIS